MCYAVLLFRVHLQGAQLIELLRKNPAVAIPVIIIRLEQKEAEWLKVGLWACAGVVLGQAVHQQWQQACCWAVFAVSVCLVRLSCADSSRGWQAQPSLRCTDKTGGRSG